MQETFKREKKNIPPDKVDEVISDYKKAGAIKTEKYQQPDKLYTVIATFVKTIIEAKAT